MNKKEVKLSINGEKWEKKIEQVFEEERKKARVDGFRVGKVPKEIFEQKVKKETFYVEAANDLVEEAYHQYLNENSDMEIVAKPIISILDINDKGVEFSFTFILKPDVELKKYTGLNIEREKDDVTEAEIDEEIDHLLDQFAEIVIKDENAKVENGDITIIDFEGFVDGKAFDGGKAENYSLQIGSKVFIPGFEEQIIGMKVGDKKDIKVTFPNEYASKELSGKEAVFKIELHEIKNRVKPEMTEDFFKDLEMDGVTDEATLRTAIREHIEAVKNHENEDKFFETILKKLAEDTKIDIPQEMLDEESEIMLDNFKRQIAQYGFDSLEKYCEIGNSTVEDLKKMITDQTREKIVYHLIMSKVKELENITVSDQDVENEISDITMKYDMPKEKIMEDFGGEQGFKNYLESKKIMHFLMKNNEKND